MSATGGMTGAEARKALEVFEELITRTAAGLRNVTVPAQLGGLVDEVVADWEAADKDFAAILRDLKGQAWQMQAEHLRAIREKVAQHLDANLAQVRKRITQLI